MCFEWVAAKQTQEPSAPAQALDRQLSAHVGEERRGGSTSVELGRLLGMAL